jgi:hypothetical protein
MPDVEPDDPVVDAPVKVPAVDHLPVRQQATGCEYTRKKNMSASIFKYFMEADKEQLQRMGIEIDAGLQLKWQTKMMTAERKPKLDDLGDALLHALNELLCGSTNYRQLVPDTPSVHNNRTVVLAILPHIAYWAVVHCTWNRFELEDFGIYESKLNGKFFKSLDVQQRILDNLDEQLSTALTEFSGKELFASVTDIKIIVKQLQCLKKHKLSELQAGSLTQSTYSAMKRSAAIACNTNCQIFERNDKNGHVYTRSDTASGHRVQVIKSTGKHLNAATTFLSWFQKFTKLDERVINLKYAQKLLFFQALCNVAASGESCLDMLQLSARSKYQLLCGPFSDPEVQSVVADLILIAINHNSGHVKAIAANSRRSHQDSVAPL